MDNQNKKCSCSPDDDVSGKGIGSPHIGVKQTASRDGIANVLSHLHKELIDGHRERVEQVRCEEPTYEVQTVVHHASGRSLRVLDGQVKDGQDTPDAPEPEPDGIDLCYDTLDDRLVKDDQPLACNL